MLPPRFGFPFVAGALIAGFYLVGRWNLARVLPDGSPFAAALEPRLLFGMAILLLPLFFRERSETDRPHPEYPLAPAALLCAFLGFFAISSLWTTAPELASEKTMEMLLMIAVSVGVALSLRRSDGAATAQSVVGWLFLGTTALAALGLATSQDEFSRLAVLGGGPNVFGRNMALWAILCSYLALSRSISWALPAGAGCLLIMLSGSRGAVLAAICGLGILFAFRRFSFKRRAIAATTIVGCTAALILLTPLGGGFGETVDRRVADRAEGNQAGVRPTLFMDAARMGLEHPIAGAGLASYKGEHGMYPHNLFLEAAAEGGLIGLGLLLGALIVAVRATLRTSRPAYVFPLLAVFLVSAQVSGDFFDSRGVFLLLLVVPALAPEEQT